MTTARYPADCRDNEKYIFDLGEPLPWKRIAIGVLAVITAVVVLLP